MIRNRRPSMDEPVADLPLFPEVLADEPAVLVDEEGASDEPIEAAEPTETAPSQEGPAQRKPAHQETDHLTVRIEAEPVVETSPTGALEDEPLAQVELPIGRNAEAPARPAGMATTHEPSAERLGVLSEPQQIALEPAVSGEVDEDPGGTQGIATLVDRFQPAAVDGVAMIGALLVLLAGGALMGAPVGLGSLAFYLPTWLLVSLLYHVLPLMFWGRTPGMARSELLARSVDGASMTGGQAIWRWVGSQVTLLCFGLPGLLALTGRSLTDRVSGTVTLRQPSP